MKMTASEYKVKREELLAEYEKRVRAWLGETDEYGIADKIPFFKDGAVNPEVWFKSGNTFRPLFVLKEVSLGKDLVKELDGFLEVWDNQTTFEFAENSFDDIKIGKFILWRKIATLAKGLEDAHNGKGITEYDIGRFSYKEGGEKYTGNISGYRDYDARTANELYNETIDKIAVLETKKIAGGRSVASELSIATRYYSEHISPFEDLICREIELLDPTVIICCSRDFFTAGLFKDVEAKTKKRPWIYGYHPTMNTTENFYYNPIKQFLESEKA